MRIKFLLTLTITLLLLAACSSEAPKIAFGDVPQTGDAGNGEKIFMQGINGAPPCSSCHSTTSTNQTGPGLEGLSERAGNRVDGETAREYVYWSIVRPTRYVVTGFSNVMYKKYDEALEPGDIADLTAFLLSL